MDEFLNAIRQFIGEITFDKVLGMLGQLATWYTAYLVYMTLKEMEKQRNLSHKPDLIIPRLSISASGDDILSLTTWQNHGQDGKSIANAKLYNIGLGTARDIHMQWDFNVRELVDTLKKHCKDNSIPIIINLNSQFLEIEGEDIKSMTNLTNTATEEHPYILPTSITSDGLRFRLPSAYLALLSVILYLWMYHSKKSEEGFSPQKILDLYHPELKLSYKDVNNILFSKKFEANFSFLYLRYSSGSQDEKSDEQYSGCSIEFTETLKTNN